MSISTQPLNIGSADNAGDGDSIRAGGAKIVANTAAVVAELDAVRQTIGSADGDTAMSIVGLTGTTVSALLAEIAGSVAQPNERVHMTDTALAPAVAGEPTVAEVTTYAAANSLSDVIAYYTGDDLPASSVTFAYHIDPSGDVTGVNAGSGGGDSIYTADGEVSGVRKVTVGATNSGDFQIVDDLGVILLRVTGGQVLSSASSVNLGTAQTQAGSFSASGYVAAGSYVQLKSAAGGVVRLSADAAGPVTSTQLALTLPAADGTSGQALVTDGAGALSFETVAGATPYIADFAAGDFLANGRLAFSAATHLQGTTVASVQVYESTGGGALFSKVSIEVDVDAMGNVTIFVPTDGTTPDGFDGRIRISA